MKIIVTGDTHMPKKAKQLPGRLLEEIKTADIVIHTGDWSSMEVYHTLAAYKNVYGVYGNVDGEEIQRFFPARQIIQLEGFKIGIVHGDGEKKTTEKRALETFEGEDVDMVIFGHSHIPLLRYFKKLLLFNPGSPTDKRRLPYYSFGILTINEGIKAEHVFFN
ncbi:metallophosphoesterase family protein [Thalassobacillus devorans]|uniref:metallophosphoesterase family protein n=1 Tax=Thalassobacillus devorans TaxID=279813 RepID=UPI000491F023|nr:metallophosphoesterase family protein [Thalassobacillus devorans]